MFKRLLLASCIFSATFAADDGYIDPDFALLTGIHEFISVESNKVFICKATDCEVCITRLHTSTAAEILHSRNPIVLKNALLEFAINTLDETKSLNVVLWADISLTLVNRSSFEEFHRQIFWNRFTLLSKMVDALLALPRDQVESNLLSLSHHIKEKLDEFSTKYDSSDVTPFKKVQYKMFETFMDDFSQIISKSE